MRAKGLFSRFFEANRDRLHFAAHSHHLWPDASFDAHCDAWRDAARFADRKWDHIFSEIMPTARGHIARILGLPDPNTIAFAPNTHEFVVRLMSALARPARVLTTDSEFHSFARQSRRWEEAGVAAFERVPVEPFESFADRFLERAASQPRDLIFVSQVFFNSGYAFERFVELPEAATSNECAIVIDGYHGFMARPTDLSAVADRVFYVAGGYKYAMSGEGACFMHCPPGIARRPVNTGWYAGFGELERTGSNDDVGYSADGMRFFGSTFDPSALYRFNAVQRVLGEQGIDVATIHRHARCLQDCLLASIDPNRPSAVPSALRSAELIPNRGFAARANFLTFRTSAAGAIASALSDRGVVVDFRDDRLRFGFGLYQDESDVNRLIEHLHEL